MKKTKLITLILGITMVTIGVLVFIHFSNDHIECENVVKYSIGENGESIKEVKHICKERFHL